MPGTTAQAGPAAADPILSKGATRARLATVSLSDLAGRPLLLIEPATAAQQTLPRFDRADLRTSVERAIANSYELASVQSRSDAQRYQVDVARGALLPRLDIRVNGGREKSRPGSLVDPVSGEPLVVSDHGRSDTTAILRQALIDPGASSEMSRQRALFASTQASVEQSRDQIALDAGAAHLDLLQYTLALDFAREYQGGLEKLFAYVNSRTQAGGASPAEAERVKARAINARSAVIEATGTLESAMISYRRLAGAVPSTLPADDVLLPRGLPDLSSAIEIAKRDNPALQALRENMRSIEEEALVARARLLPKFEFELGNFRTRNAGGKPGTSNDTRAMLVLSMNLLNGGADVAQVRSVLARFDEAKFKILDAERKLEESLIVSYNTLDAVTRRIVSVREEYLANQKVVIAFGDQLVSANRPLLDVLDAQQRLFQSRTELLRLTLLEANLALQAAKVIGGLAAYGSGSSPNVPPVAAEKAAAEKAAAEKAAAEKAAAEKAAAEKAAAEKAAAEKAAAEKAAADKAAGEQAVAGRKTTDRGAADPAAIDGNPAGRSGVEPPPGGKSGADRAGAERVSAAPATAGGAGALRPVVARNTDLGASARDAAQWDRLIAQSTAATPALLQDAARGGAPAAASSSQRTRVVPKSRRDAATSASASNGAPGAVVAAGAAGVAGVTGITGATVAAGATGATGFVGPADAGTTGAAGVPAVASPPPWTIPAAALAEPMPVPFERSWERPGPLPDAPLLSYVRTLFPAQALPATTQEANKVAVRHDRAATPSMPPSAATDDVRSGFAAAVAWLVHSGNYGLAPEVQPPQALPVLDALLRELRESTARAAMLAERDATTTAQAAVADGSVDTAVMPISAATALADAPTLAEARTTADARGAAGGSGAADSAGTVAAASDAGAAVDADSIVALGSSSFAGWPNEPLPLPPPRRTLELPTHEPRAVIRPAPGPTATAAAVATR